MSSAYTFVSKIWPIIMKMMKTFYSRQSPVVKHGFIEQAAEYIMEASLVVQKFMIQPSAGKLMLTKFCGSEGLFSKLL